VVKQLSLGLGLGWSLVGVGFSLFDAVAFEDNPRDYVDVLYYVLLPVGLALQGAVSGLVVGVLLDRKLGVRVNRGFVARHIIAFAGSVLAVMLAVELVDRVWGSGEGLMGPGSLCLCGCWTLAWVNCLMVPAAVVGEASLLNGDWRGAVVAGSVCVVVGLVPFPVYSVWAVAYGIIYAGISVVWMRVSDRLVSQRKEL
jgi:hypothetical protein